MEARRCARRRKKLFERHLQGVGDAMEHRQGRIRAARFEVRPGGARKARQARHLLLRHAATVPQLAHVRGEMAREGIHVHANRIAFCQQIVPADILAAGTVKLLPWS